MPDARAIPVTILEEDQTWLRPPGEAGSLMDLLLAAGTHRLERSADGVVRVVPIEAGDVDEIVVVVRRARP